MNQRNEKYIRFLKVGELMSIILLTISEESSPPPVKTTRPLSPMLSPIQKSESSDESEEEETLGILQVKYEYRSLFLLLRRQSIKKQRRQNNK